MNYRRKFYGYLWGWYGCGIFVLIRLEESNIFKDFGFK